MPTCSLWVALADIVKNIGVAVSVKGLVHGGQVALRQSSPCVY